jgi:hypothetical protein
MPSDSRRGQHGKTQPAGNPDRFVYIPGLDEAEADLIPVRRIS